MLKNGEKVLIIGRDENDRDRRGYVGTIIGSESGMWEVSLPVDETEDANTAGEQLLFYPEHLSPYPQDV